MRLGQHHISLCVVRKKGQQLINPNGTSLTCETAVLKGEQTGWPSLQPCC